MTKPIKIRFQKNATSTASQTYKTSFSSAFAILLLNPNAQKKVVTLKMAGNLQ